MVQRAHCPCVAHLPEVWPQPSLCLWAGGGSWALRTARPLSFKERKSPNFFGGEKTVQQPSLLCAAKRNGKMLSPGDKSEVPFAFLRGKCIASSPHPNLGNRLIRTLQKAKRRGLEGPFPWGQPNPPAAGPQGRSPSLGWVPPLCSVFQGPTKPPAPPLGQIPTHSTPQGGGKNITRQQHRGASGHACKFSPGCCQRFGRRCLLRVGGGDTASSLCGCERAPVAFRGIASLQPREPPPYSQPTACTRFL